MRVTPCLMHRWLFEPCPWRKSAYVVRCQDCGRKGYLVTMVVRGRGVRFVHEPHPEG